MANPSLVVVLAEDRRQQRFIREYLRHFCEPHQIRLAPLPAGGSGEQFVRKHYASDVKDHRTRAARAGTALFIAIDADTGTVAARRTQLAAILAEAALPPRTATEAVVHIIPKRNIETWLFCLTGTAVNEETDYKSQDPRVDNLVKPAAVTFMEWNRPNAAVPPHGIASLTEAFIELRRLV